MDQRIQQALDGDIDRHRLSAVELDELRQAESAFDAVLNAIQVDRLPDLAPTVLGRIRREARDGALLPVKAEPARKPSRLSWLWTPRPITLRPVYALTASVLIALLTVGPMFRTREIAAPSSQVLTQFVLRVPNATTVSLAGDFSGWQPRYTMTRSGAETWTVVVPLDPGVHMYSFVIDGEKWIADPMAPSVDDGFGGLNSRVAVLMPDARKL